MLSQYPPLFFRAVDIFDDLCDDNHHEGQIEMSLLWQRVRIPFSRVMRLEPVK